MIDVDSMSIALDEGGLAAMQVAMGLVMFGVALDLRVSDFRDLLAEPRAPLVGLLCQFGLLPALACPLALWLAPTPSMALGMMLVAACPGGNISNFLTQIGGGRVAVSVGMTAVSTVAAVVSTPLNLHFWGTRSVTTASIVRDFGLDPLDMLVRVAVLLGVPVILGMAVRHYRGAWADRLSRWMKVGSLLFFVAVVGLAFGANFDLFLTAIGLVFLPVLVLNALALGLGYGAGGLAGLPEPDRRALMFEVGIQNSGLGLVLVLTFFDGLGGMAIVCAWWGIWHIIAGLALVAWFRFRDRTLAQA